ncbi:Clavaminate synthase-like protein [Cenococcum geophilum 1.58]|uniref:Clavaminate synthase-like protein n=1 Tax=Cenococcum geophilum 1.58 TaxID=794803 RepID=UPI00358EB427|nr:Clavaminate synthase-like protein [Cenococcum geophilum 1.58]
MDLAMPPKYSGSLDHLEFIEVTIIGREYTTAKINDILHASNAERQIRDLAVIISERGVCFFRAPQDGLGVEDGRPKENGLHVRPPHRDPANVPMGNGETDENIYVINSEAQKEMYISMIKNRPVEPKDLGREWHSDATFENFPSDSSCLLMQETPSYGGGTLWCSGYELYGRTSLSFRAYLETLTATCAQPVFRTASVARIMRSCLSVFAGMGLHVSRINDDYAYEDHMVGEYLMRLVTRNYDCVARMRWTKNGVAIWNNSCIFHAVAPDTHLVPRSLRLGIRASSIGEVLYLDPNSTSRKGALGITN